uniref:apolipoprotein N-acyltransferase n=1 Tax=Thaumasiovibrio occultus TaxID=1891184 RepID=UPI000B35A63E|nr:apolipoprotein N-acyltransferase [Thaumasiovibrio occultus]
MLAKLSNVSRPVGAVFSGAIATLAFAPFSWWPLAILSVFILFYLLENATPKQGAWLGLLWGLGQFGTGVSWVYVSIGTFGGLPLAAGLTLIALLVLYLALYPALFGYLYRRLFCCVPNTLRLLVWAPILWLLLDWLRGWAFTGFPWLWLGYSQTTGPMAPLAPILGVEGITLAILLIASSGVLWQQKSPRTALGTIVGVVLVTGLSWLPTWVTPKGETGMDVAVIQGNIPQALKWQPSMRWPTLMRYADMTRENWDADIVVWPEAAIPALEEEVIEYLTNMDSAAKMNNTGLITGVLDYTADEEYYNNILTLGNNNQPRYRYDTAQRYSKHHLLPFGEYVPFGELLSPLLPNFEMLVSSFSRGNYIQPNLEVAGHHIAPALCYEVAFNEQVRQNITPETDILLTLSNDAWFGKSIGPYQHLEIAQMRAIEFGRPMIRATNTGISALIDYRGQITATIPQFEQATLRGMVQPMTGTTPFNRYGSLPLWLFVAFGLMSLTFLQRAANRCCSA